MKRIRTLLAAWIAATAVSLALSTAASAAGTALHGQYVDFYSNGQGRFDAYFNSHHGGYDAGFYSTGSATNGTADAGISLTIYGTDSNSQQTATIYGVHGVPFQSLTVPTPIPNQPLGTQKLGSVYLAGQYDASGVCIGNPCLKVTENAEYTYNGNVDAQVGDDLAMKYHVDNEGTQPVRFRLTAVADTEPGDQYYSYESAIGFFNQGTTKTIGAENPGYGSRISFQESSTTPWDRFQEDVPSEIWKRVENPLSAVGDSGLTNTVRDTAYLDSALAAEWDAFKNVGLPPNDISNPGAEFQYLILFHDWAALTLDDPHPYGSPLAAQTGQQALVTATSRNGDGSGGTNGSANNLPIRYRVDAGPNSGNGDYASFQRATTASGQASLTWNSGGATSEAPYSPISDHLQAFVDVNDDGYRQPWEPTAGRSFYWYQPLEVTALDSSQNIGSDNSFSVDPFDHVQRTFKYKVTGANPQGNPSDLVHGAITCDPLSTCDPTQVPLIGNNPGTDKIEVWMDLDNDGDDTDVGEYRTIRVEWYSNLTLSTGDAVQYVQGSTHSLYAYLNVPLGDDPAGKVLHYRVEGANAVSDTDTDPTIDYDGYDTGRATIPLGSANAGESKITVWYDSDATTGPSTGDPIGITYIDWVASDPSEPGYPINRLTFAQNYQYLTTGHTGTATGTLKTASGATDSTAYKIRYVIYGPDGFPDTKTVTNSAGGFSIPLAGTTAGADDIEAYVDYNDNGQQDGNEPEASTSVYWRPPVAFTGYYSYYYGLNPYTDSPDNYDYGTATVSGPVSIPVELRGPTGALASSQNFTWSVLSGPNTGMSGSGQTGTTQLFTAGHATIGYTGGASVGTDVVQVSFTDGAGPHTGTYRVHWLPALTLSPNSQNLSTDATGVITATLRNPNTNTPAVGARLAYEINGAHQNGPVKSATLDTNGSGQVTISIVGTVAETDYVHVWADYDDDGVRDQNEPDSTATITFHNRVDITSANPSSTYGYEGASKSVTVTFRNDAYQPLANKQLKYIITGANPVAAPAVTTDSNGKATITWVGKDGGTNGGYATDTLIVFEDLNHNDVPDAGEHQSVPYTQYWYGRLDMTYLYGNGGSQDVNTTPTTSRQFQLVATDGSTPVANATLAYEITGANPKTGTVTTGGDGKATVTWTGTVAGRDDLKIWNDLDNNGQRDSGEPLDTEAYAYWTSPVVLNPSSPSAKYQGDTQSISFSVPSGHHACYNVSGPNSKGDTSAGAGNTGNIVLTGTNAGTDYLFVWDDTTADCHFQSGEKAGRVYMLWRPRISLTGGLGSHVAGGQVSVTGQLLTIGGANAAGVAALKYKIDGQNPQGVTPINTNAAGNATITWDGTHSGYDTLTIWKDDVVADNQPGPGEFVNTRTVYWAPPPVRLSLSHNTTNTALAGNDHTVTATVSGLTIPSGGFPIHFSVSGANTVSDTVATSSGTGVATFQWNGAIDGTDTVTAWADVSGTTGSKDDFDPGASTTMTWTPLLQGSSPTSDQVVGEPHTETITLVNPNGTPASNVLVFYQITGANPTGGLQQARAIGSGTGAVIHKRTDGSGNVNITWSGANLFGGTDTLDVWGDTDNSNTVTATDPHTTRTVAWRAASTTTAPPGSGTTTTTTPTATSSAVVPGSPEDLDGLPTPPPPVVAKSVNVAPVKGRVFVKLPGKAKFIELLDAEQIPVGSIVDVRKGTVALTSAQNLTGGVATAEFYAGQFQIAQKKAAKPVTDLVLYGGSFAGCGKLARTGSAHGSQKKKIRELWGNGKGSFRTKGKYAAAAIRGTKWDVVDYCDGTLVKVAQGVVTVEPNKGKSQALKAPKSLFVPTAGLAKKKK